MLTKICRQQPPFNLLYFQTRKLCSAKKMLQEYQNKEELQKLFKECQSTAFPHFLNIRNDILTKITQKFPESVSRYFVYQNEKDGRNLIVLYRKYIMEPHRPMLAFHYDINSKFDKNLIFNIYDEIASITQSPNHNVPVTCVYGHFASHFNEWYNNRFKTTKTIKPSSCLMYYMTQEQQDVLIKECQNGIPLSDGYYFDESNYKSDIDVIIGTSKFLSQNDQPIIEALLRRMPYALIRHKSSPKEIAGFFFSDAGGCLNHQFVLPKHRGKYLGPAVENLLCQKLIKENMIPFKFVEESNTNVIASSNKSKFWTRWEDSNGPIMQYWMTEH